MAAIRQGSNPFSFRYSTVIRVISTILLIPRLPAVIATLAPLGKPLSDPEFLQLLIDSALDVLHARTRKCLLGEIKFGKHDFTLWFETSKLTMPRKNAPYPRAPGKPSVRRVRPFRAPAKTHAQPCPHAGVSTRTFFVSLECSTECH